VLLRPLVCKQLMTLIAAVGPAVQREADHTMVSGTGLSVLHPASRTSDETREQPEHTLLGVLPYPALRTNHASWREFVHGT